MRAFLKTFFLLMMLPGLEAVQAQEVNDSTEVTHAVTFSGQATVWEVTRFSNPLIWQAGGRFVSTLLGNFDIGKHSKLDFEASLHLNGALNFTGLDYSSKNGEISPYRVWLRYSTDHWEVRAGLQKINFGTAKMFRPLMWFDQMDVRDPLRLTNGVYGILGKYFFKNNSNIWLWTLAGNKKPKGWEYLGSKQWKPEVGGRLEVPLLQGEIALSTNFRSVELPVTGKSLQENRIGLDGKWDVGPGIWFESSITQLQKNDYNLPLYQDAWNVGTDYTLNIGSGIGLTLEYFRYHSGNDFLVNGTGINLLGSMITYPVSMLDNLSAVIFYTGGNYNLWFNYLSWSRTYDNLSFYLMAFWNPEISLPLNTVLQGKNLFAGKGVQVMVSYNF